MVKSVFEHEKTIEITKEDAPWAPEEELGEYHLKRWTWFDKQKSIEESTTILDLKKGIGQASTTEYFRRMMFRTVIKSPLEAWTVERVGELDPQVGDILMKTCRDLNGLTAEEEQAFLERSASEEDISG